MKRVKTKQWKLFVLLLAVFCLASSSVWAEINWTTKSSMPTARYGAASGTVNGKIYVLGGSNYIDIPPAGTISIVEMYDPLTDLWFSMPSLVVPRFAGGDATLGSTIYIAGGTDIGGPPIGPNYQNTVVAYDTTNGTSAIIGYLNSARFRTDADIINGKIYVVGGSGDIYALDSIEEYDLSTNTSIIKTTLPEPRDMPTVVSSGNKLYILGGFDRNYAPMNNCWEYDPTTNTFDIKSPMPIARGGIKGAVVLNNKIYVLGGVITPDLPPLSIISDIQEYITHQQIHGRLLAI